MMMTNGKSFNSALRLCLNLVSSIWGKLDNKATFDDVAFQTNIVCPLDVGIQRIAVFKVAAPQFYNDDWKEFE